MPRETEIKLRVADVAVFHAALARLGARDVARSPGAVHEKNVLFDTNTRQLKRREQLLRIRTETRVGGGSRKTGAQRTLLTFKRPAGRMRVAKKGSSGHKVSEEVELQVSDGQALLKIFERLGMRPWFRYEKYRTTYRLPKAMRWAEKLLIELDETPIGTFVELEGPASAIDRAAKALGFTRLDYIAANYFVLYREECRRRGEEPRDMLFARRGTRR